MAEKDKSKEELVEEIKLLQKRIAELEIVTSKQQQQQQQIRRLATVVRDSYDAITIQDFEGSVISWNHGAELMYGYSEEDALKKSIDLLTPPDKVAEQKEFTRRLVEGEPVVSFETQRVTKDGRVLDVWLTVTKVLDDSGKPIGIASTERDITERKKAIEQIASLSKFPSENPNPVMRVGSGKKIVYLNAAAKELLAEASLDVGQVIPQQWWKYYDDLWSSGGVKKDMESEIGDRTYLWTAAGIAGQYVNVYGIDITERKKAEEEMHKQLSLTKTITDNAASCLFMMDVKGYPTFMNPAAEKVTGYTLDRIKDRPLHDSVHFKYPDGRPYPMSECPIDNAQAVLAEMKNYEDVFTREDGSLYPVMCYLAPLAIDEKVYGSVLEFRDITERKVAEEALRHEKELAQAYLEVAAVIMLVLDKDGKVSLINQKGCEILGYEREDIVGKGWFDNFLPEGKKAEEKGVFLRLMHDETGLFGYQEYAIKAADGKERLIAWNNTVLRDDDGKVAATLSSGEDITEARADEKALKDSEGMLKSVISAAPIGIGIASKRIMEWANERLAEITGYSQDEMVGKNVRMLYAEDEEFDRVGKSLYGELRKQGIAAIETLWKHKDGRVLNIYIRASTIEEGNFDRGIVFTATDISERKHYEESLKRSEERFRVLFEFAPDAYYLTDLKGSFIDGNIRAEDLSGYNREELRGKNFLALGMLQKDQVLKAATHLARNVIGQSTGPDEFTLKRKDGTSVLVEIVTHPIKLQDKIIVLGMARDIGSRKKSEKDLKGAQNRLIQSEKMAAIGSFSAGIAHEVKNPLGVILSGAEFLEVKLPRYDNEVTSTLEKIKEASLRANFVLQALLQFARPSEFKTQMTKPEDIVKPIVDLMMHRARFAGITITSEIGAEPPAVPADGNQIQQVVFNAVKNAMEAMAEGGTITIRTYKSFDKDLFRGKPAFFIEINDTGHGISAENLKKLFEPFFTTKEEGKGTGLGLYISRSIVEAHGGKLLVDSVVGKGTSVRIVLPLRK